MTEHSFAQDLFGEETIIAQSRFHQKQLNKNMNSWIQVDIKRSILEDESEFLQYGQSLEYTFYKQDLLTTEQSSWSHYPTADNPFGLFKYMSFDIYFSQDLQKINRQTYSFLDFLGDLGGLFEALNFICWIFVTPIASCALQSSLLTNLFEDESDKFDSIKLSETSAREKKPPVSP